MAPAVGSAPAASAAAAEDPAPLTEAQRALASAKDSGEQVEVAGERSERTTVYANPDGFTFTLEESVVPVRVAKSGGGWQAPDPTLKRNPDGTVAPKAAAVEMEFSAGGADSPLVRIEERGRSLELGWPGTLPAPELDGASALYRDVKDGVDLKVTASTEGFRHVLIVKTPQAAARSDLKQIDYSLKADGLKIVKGRPATSPQWTRTASGSSALRRRRCGTRRELPRHRRPRRAPVRQRPRLRASPKAAREQPRESSRWPATR